MDKFIVKIVLSLIVIINCSSSSFASVKSNKPTKSNFNKKQITKEIRKKKIMLVDNLIWIGMIEMSKESTRDMKFFKTQNAYSIMFVVNEGTLLTASNLLLKLGKGKYKKKTKVTLSLVDDLSGVEGLFLNDKKILGQYEEIKDTRKLKIKHLSMDAVNKLYDSKKKSSKQLVNIIQRNENLLLQLQNSSLASSNDLLLELGP